MTIYDKIRALGLAFTPEQIQGSIGLFAPLLPQIDETSVTRDIQYGPDARHRLDLFGSGTGSGRPIVVFIHGGGFIMGDKGNAGQPFYNNFGDWAARQGWLGCTATYRLAPANPWPAGSEDLAAVVKWLRENAAEHGGDPEKIILVGQSAGAAHVASYVAGCGGFSDAEAPMIAGAIMMSGVYDLANSDHSPFEAAYYGTDASRFPEQSSVAGLARTPLPCLFTLAENDPENFQRQAALMIGPWVAAKGKWPDFVILKAHNHITPVHMLGGSADEVGPILKEFVDKTVG
ncbi:alpha/beta hydrolase [Sphingomonas sp. MMS24-J13]|uniref:alpha/beta hydrolase n=1 Tax=Sphingomonas sp. MMS24-J13 TaxID=3238686 RepID=UPI00384F9F69